MKVYMQSWHYKLLRWTYHSVPRNLCPYVDKLILAIVLVPFLLFWRNMPFVVRIVTLIEAAIVFISEVAFLTNGLTGTFIDIFATINIVVGLLGGGFVGIMFCITKLADYLDDRSVKLRERRWLEDRNRVSVPRQNIVKEYFKAKHAKVCPRIEFVNRPLEENSGKVYIPADPTETRAKS